MIDPNKGHALFYVLLALWMVMWVGLVGLFLYLMVDLLLREAQWFS